MKGITLIEVILVVAAIAIFFGIIIVATCGDKPECKERTERQQLEADKDFCRRQALTSTYEQLSVLCKRYYK